MKNKINMIFKILTLLLLCTGFTLAIMEAQWIWAFSYAAALVHEFRRFLLS